MNHPQRRSLSIRTTRRYLIHLYNIMANFSTLAGSIELLNFFPKNCQITVPPFTIPALPQTSPLKVEKIERLARKSTENNRKTQNYCNFFGFIFNPFHSFRTCNFGFGRISPCNLQYAQYAIRKTISYILPFLYQKSISKIKVLGMSFCLLIVSGWKN